MKSLIITSLSALALAMAFTGCGDSGSVSSSSDGSSSATTNNEVTTGTTTQIVDNGNTSDTTITNEFGLNPALGTPPPLPAS